MEYVDPPSDPNEWTDEQWIDWLKATDDDTPVNHERLASVMQRVAESTPGQVLGQAMLGLSHAMYGVHDEDVVIVVDANGETTEDEPFAVRLDPEHPERSSVVFRTPPDSAAT